MGGAASLAATIYQASTWVLPVVFAVTFHEAAHGFIALRFGDDTALRARRVTFNPLNHIDPFGTIILPALLLLGSGGRLLFGYAKPVPVNFGRLHDPRRDMVWVALAGPGTNVLLAIVSSLLFYGVAFLPASPAEWIAANLVHSLQINAALCVFNMLPLPPWMVGGSRSACCRAHSPIRSPGSSRMASRSCWLCCSCCPGSARRSASISISSPM